MKLSNKQKKFLRAKAHSLNVVVTLGAKGLTKPVKDETDLALSIHELIKVKLPADEKAAKKAMLIALSQSVRAVDVQLIGRVGVIYRPNDPAVIVLPKDKTPT